MFTNMTEKYGTDFDIYCDPENVQKELEHYNDCNFSYSVEDMYEDMMDEARLNNLEQE